MNSVKLSGTVTGSPKFSHKNRADNVYSFFVSVPRRSGKADIIPCYAEERTISGISVGSKIDAVGYIRSMDLYQPGNKRKLLVSVYVTKIFSYTEEKNCIDIRGHICKDPLYRLTPLGRRICEIFLAVKANNQKNQYYIPCIAWGMNAIKARNLTVGEGIEISGRFQSREYMKNFDDGTQETRIAYEVSVSRIDVVESEEKNEND